MKRLLAIAFTVILVATACGSSEDSFIDQLAELGIPAEQSQCIIDELAERGLSVNDLTDDAIGDGDLPDGVFEAMTACAGAGLEDDADTDDDTDDPDDESGAEDRNAIELAMIDGLVDSGVSQDAAECILDELNSRDFDLFELAFSDDDLPDDLFEAALACGDELVDGGFDFSQPGLDGDDYGDNPELDALWDACDAGDGAACDELYFASPLDSGYEAFADTCGDRLSESVPSCEDELGGDTGVVDTYGDDAVFDFMWDECEAGNGTACDDLYFSSPLGSDYENFGSTCGELFPPTSGACEEGLGVGSGGDANAYGDDPFFDGLWDACAAGDGVACDDLFFQSPIDSEYEEFGNTCGNRFDEGVGLCVDAMST